MMPLISNKKNLGIVSMRGHHFHSRFLNKSSVVIDLGSHLGQFSDEVNRQFGCQCHAVEALPSLYQKIKESGFIKKYNYAITSINQPISLEITDNPESNYIQKNPKNNLNNNIEISGITLEKFIKDHEISQIDLVKIDIEGAEVDLFDSISDQTLAKIKQITIEFHDFKLPIQQKVDAIIKRLQDIGFYYIPFSWHTRGDVLFINRNQCLISFWELFFIKYWIKYLRGLTRKIKKVIYSNK